MQKTKALPKTKKTEKIILEVNAASDEAEELKRLLGRKYSSELERATRRIIMPFDKSSGTGKVS